MKISLLSRLLLGVGGLLILSSLLLPLWQIQLWAPQYPEGLNMKIWHNRLTGAFDIINGLNHYIGMREIRAEMFPELKFIGILIGIFSAIGMLGAFMGTRRWLTAFVLVSFLYGGAAIWDFWRWGYDYGHNLDPHAAIIVPGMAYQPPVIGYKNLLNFTAYSGPDTGGWIIIVVGAIAALLLVYEYRLGLKKGKTNTASVIAVAALGLSLFSAAACNKGPEPIRYGVDDCKFCKMTLTDVRYGAELVTDKGKVFKFDDMNCLVNFMNDQPGQYQIWVVNFNRKGELMPAEKAYYLKNEALKSPMRADIAAFATTEDRTAVKNQLGGGVDLDWAGVFKN